LYTAVGILLNFGYGVHFADLAVWLQLPFLDRPHFFAELFHFFLNKLLEFVQRVSSFHFLPFIKDRGTVWLVGFVVIRRQIWMLEGLGDRHSLCRVETQQFLQ
jgi:hypothetical protein